MAGRVGRRIRRHGNRCRAFCNGAPITMPADGGAAADPGVDGVESLAVREPKVGEEQVVEPPPKVSGLALVRNFIGQSGRRDVDGKIILSSTSSGRSASPMKVSIAFQAYIQSSPLGTSGEDRFPLRNNVYALLYHPHGMSFG